MRPLKKRQWLLFDVPDYFSNLRMSIRAIHPLRFIPPDHPKANGACEKAVEKSLWCLKYVPLQYKTEEMCNRAVEKNPQCLEYAPDRLKTEDMSERAVEKHPWTLEFAPNHLKTQEMYQKAVEKTLWQLEFVPDHLKTQGMCEKAVKKKPTGTRICFRLVCDARASKGMARLQLLRQS